MRLPIAITLLASLCACQVAPAAKPHGAATAKPAVAATSAAAAATAHALQSLKTPADQSVALSGVASVEAGAIAAHGGRLLATPAGAVAAAGGTLLSNNGGSLVDKSGAVVAGAGGNAIPDTASGVTATSGGAALVANDGTLLAAGASLIANNSAGLLSNNGGSLISDNGGAVISNNAGSLVANNAGNLVGKTRYRLMAADARVPAAGMLVSAISLKTHQYLPVGQDAEGKPVYVVYSGLDGGYKLYLPADEAQNVLVAVSAPPHEAASVRLNALNTDPTAPLDPNESSDAATRAAIDAFAGEMAKFMTASSLEAGSDALHVNDAGAVGQLATPLLTRLYAAAQAAHIPTSEHAADIPEVRQLSKYLVEMIVGFSAKDSLKVSREIATSWEGHDEPALTALTETFQALRDATAAYKAAHPDLASLPVSLDTRKGPDQPLCVGFLNVSLSDPTTLCYYALQTFVTSDYYFSEPNVARTFLALTSPAVDPVLQASSSDIRGMEAAGGDPNLYVDAVNGASLRYSDRLSAALRTLALSYLGMLASQPDLVDGISSTIGAYMQAHPAGSPAPTSAIPSVTCTVK